MKDPQTQALSAVLLSLLASPEVRQLIRVAQWPDLMDRKTAADYWSVSERKFGEMVSAGIITGRKLGPRCVRYCRRDLDAAAERLESGKGQAPE